MLTDDMLKEERPHPLGGVQRIYALPNAYALSLTDTPLAHAYEFAWEAAVFGIDGHLTYATPLTSDVEVFFTDEQANDFIARAKAWAEEERMRFDNEDMGSDD